MHLALAVTTEGIPLGLLDQEIWTPRPCRDWEEQSQTKHSTRDKESVKWLECLDHSLEGVPIRAIHNRWVFEGQRTMTGRAKHR